MAMSCQNTNTPASDQALEDFDASVFCLINEERAAHGPGLPSPQRRPAQRRLRLRRLDGGGWILLTLRRLLRPPGRRHPGLTAASGGLHPSPQRWIVGENLHWTTAEESTPADVVQAWMESPLHRKYLLKAKFRDLGVAAIRGIPSDPSQTDGITVASEYGLRHS
jgi:hypothetical protein